MSKFFCNGADAECSCPILCGDCKSADWTGGTEIKTNADHIRSMTDEDLAEFLYAVDIREGATDTDGWLDFIKKPYGGDT